EGAGRLDDAELLEQLVGVLKRLLHLVFDKLEPVPLQSLLTDLLGFYQVRLLFKIVKKAHGRSLPSGGSYGCLYTLFCQRLCTGSSSRGGEAIGDCDKRRKRKLLRAAARIDAQPSELVGGDQARERVSQRLSPHRERPGDDPLETGVAHRVELPR